VNEFDKELKRRLEDIRSQGLLRELREVDSAQGTRVKIDGKSLLNFSSNDYLGLANHPALKEAAVKAIEQFGAGSGASRLICGSLAPHHELEEALAKFKQTESALSFSSGYAAALGTITALAGKDDVVVLDKLVHASIVDAARLSGAKLRVFDHNDLDQLADILDWAEKREKPSRTLVITESVFSMDGDIAPLREIVALKEKHGAWLMVDEAHATGLFGANRRGVAEQLGVSERVEIQMGTLGKALGSAGGFICGSRTLTELLVNRARSFIFSTAPVPAAAAAARAGIGLVESKEGKERCVQLWSLLKHLQDGLAKLLSPAPVLRSAIVPIILGQEERAVSVASTLREAGIFIPAIRYPSVAKGQARLRMTLSAGHTDADMKQLLKALKAALENG
jgi:8-amino-7-oxononanoate synthase